MNERIQELAWAAEDYAESIVDQGGGFHQAYTRKFAELIVKECCEVLEQTEDALDRQKWPTPRGCVEYIKDHFGVE
jgi:hypothetical protein